MSLRERPNRRGWIVLVIAAVMVCGAGGVCAASIALTNRQPTTAFEVQMCLGLVTAGRTQVGLWWQAIFMSRLMPAALSPYARCAYLPWSPSLPPAGEVAFPP